MMAAEPSPLAVEDSVPEGWTLARAGDLLRLTNGFPFKPSHWKGRGLPIIRIQNLNNPDASFNYCPDHLLDKYHVKHGDLLFAWSGTPGTSFGAHIWPGDSALLNQHIFRVDFDTQLFDKGFLRLSINRNLDEYISQAHGGVGLAHITKGKFEASFLAFPPVAEQKRIMAKIEQLLAYVNVGRERLARVPLILKRFRQAVLAAACSGRLTTYWRDQHSGVTSDDLVEELRGWNKNRSQFGQRSKQTQPIELGITSENLPEAPATWNWIAFGDMLLSLRSGSSEVPQNDPTEYPILRSSSVRPRFADLQDVRFLSAKQSQRAENFLAENDLLFTRLSGSLEYVANCALVRNLSGRRIQYPDRLFCGRLKEPRCARYVEIAFANPLLRDFLQVESKSSAGHQRISMGALTKFPVPLPPLDEQNEIIRRVKALFKLADAIEKRVAAATARAETLTQAILAKAFRGELVPTEAELARREGRSYEPASALLDRIRASQARAPHA